MHYVARIKKKRENWVYITIWALVHIIPLQTLLWISKEYWKCCILSCSQSSLSLWSDAWHHFAGKTLTGYSHQCLRLPGFGEVATPSFSPPGSTDSRSDREKNTVNHSFPPFTWWIASHFGGDHFKHYWWKAQTDILQIR